MDDFYDLTLSHMESTLHGLAECVPEPVRVPYKDGFVYRYVERTLHQALVQKLARMVSTLHAARLLMEHGFLQEQASLQRMLDELFEDIAFLSFAVIYDEITSLHQDYLDAFFQEEFDKDSPIASTQKRPMILRKKIHAYIVRVQRKSGGKKMDPSRGAELLRTMHKAYSGFVHAASPQLMEMYGGNPPQFQVRGMHGSGLHREHRAELWSYFYRGIATFGFVTKAFGSDKLFDSIHQYLREFERATGKDYQSKDWDRTGEGA